MRICARVFKRDDGLCVPCAALGRTTVAIEVDHIVPLIKGGSNDLANLQSICRECHDRKTAEDMGKGHRRRPTVGRDGWPID